jgi:ABC-type sugar transport system permease subunit
MDEFTTRKISRGKTTTRLQQEARVGLIFLAPWLVGFFLFKALPILAGFVFSLTDFRMLEPEATQFIGLDNYARLIGDANAGANLFGSLGYFLLTVPLEMIAALALAAISTSARIVNRKTLRTLIFMTSIIPATSIFLILLGSADYLQRLVFDKMQIPPVDPFLLLTPFLALWSIGPGFLIMVSAMESVPAVLYEAARVDGAGPMAQFVFVTLPMISPAIFFTLVINLTGAFGGSLLLDRGYVFNFSLSPMEGYINEVMFTRTELGYASTLAFVAFLVMMTLTVVLFRSSRRWVYFPEEDDHVEI